MKNEQISLWNKQLKDKSAEEVLQFFLSEFQGKIALSNSLSAEDQVITHMICSIDKTTEIFTLDTGRMFPETYEVLDKTEMKYGIKIRVYFPEFVSVQNMVNSKGINLFYESIENRLLCCNIRKVEPLKRAFKNLDAWICGLRKEQSTTRNNMALIEWDNANGLLKINPLMNWSEKNVWDYVKENQVPYNTLHNKGFPSIGCQPCTRAVKNGEDIRAGRWWWEDPENKECGLHKK